jgi:uncharacterized metal-binding protein YceD (DUF177 family)
VPLQERPWSVPLRLDDVPETGRHVALRADESTRAAVARAAALPAIKRLEAAFEVTRESGDRLRVMGQVSAAVEQTCVVTLEPLTNEIEEPVDLLFAPEVSEMRAHGLDDDEIVASGPEPLVNGAVDLGAIAVEFLMLGIDPYPRKPGVVFESPEGEDRSPKPFAALAALKKGPRSSGA